MAGLFERACKMKLRFTYKGKLTTEDLFDLSLGELDKMYGVLRIEQKNAVEESLLKKATKESTALNLRVDIVKHIVETKLANKEAREMRAASKQQKEKIAAIIEKKQDASLEEKSIEELQKTMAELEE